MLRWLRFVPSLALFKVLPDLCQKINTAPLMLVPVSSNRNYVFQRKESRGMVCISYGDIKITGIPSLRKRLWMAVAVFVYELSLPRDGAKDMHRSDGDAASDRKPPIHLGHVVAKYHPKNTTNFCQDRESKVRCCSRMFKHVTL